VVIVSGAGFRRTRIGPPDCTPAGVLLLGSCLTSTRVRPVPRSATRTPSPCTITSAELASSPAAWAAIGVAAEPFQWRSPDYPRTRRPTGAAGLIGPAPLAPAFASVAAVARPPFPAGLGTEGGLP
jgi:hypothetical protein